MCVTARLHNYISQRVKATFLENISWLCRPFFILLLCLKFFQKPWFHPVEANRCEVFSNFTFFRILTHCAFFKKGKDEKILFVLLLSSIQNWTLSEMVQSEVDSFPVWIKADVFFSPSIFLWMHFSAFANRFHVSTFRGKNENLNRYIRIWIW